MHNHGREEREKELEKKACGKKKQRRVEFDETRQKRGSRV